MQIEQIYTGCLAEASYLVESAGEVAIIDPLRESEPYLQRAKKYGGKIKYIFETHFHADFVSGHLSLAQKTGGTIVYGPQAKPEFNAYIAHDKEIFQVGDVRIKVLHTPGHTLESSCFLLIDERGSDYALFTGDTLFLGDVGRPDLAITNLISKEDLASMLYDSLHQKILPLKDSLIIYPGHGQGSACGKNMSKETVDTLGHQKRTNYALQPDMSKEEFVAEITAGLLPPPQYFPKNAALNRKGYENFEIVLQRGLNALSADEFIEKQREGALVLDVREAQVFCKGFVPKSMNIGLDGMFAVWVGTLIENIKQEIILICPEGREEETVTRLARVGYDYCIGYLKSGFEAWLKSGKSVDHITSITAQEFSSLYNTLTINAIDVRKAAEFALEHVEGVLNVPLEYLHQYLDKLDASQTYYLYCAGGYRSMIAASIMKANGIPFVIDVMGGYQDIRLTNIKKSNLELEAI
jgi:glyoxylase-like metal-dependent hydrolase (beta-lactamase superfamily II)/rhodanese-related sulfurtransferase